MNGGSRKELINDILTDKEFRHFWCETYLKENIPFQMKTMRTQRGLRQTEAAELLGKGQNALSRLESPAYGRLSLQTLLEVARGYDVGLIVKFVPFSRLLKEYDDVSFDSLKAASPDADRFPEEIQEIEDWANEVEDQGLWEANSSSVVVTSSKFAPSAIIQKAPPTHTLPFPIGLPTNTNFREATEWETMKEQDTETEPYRPIKNARSSETTFAATA